MLHYILFFAGKKSGKVLQLGWFGMKTESRWKKEIKSKNFLILQTSVHVKLLEDCKSFYHELVETLDTHIVQYIKIHFSFRISLHFRKRGCLPFSKCQQLAQYLDQIIVNVCP